MCTACLSIPKSIYRDPWGQRKSYNWEGFKQLLAYFGLVRPHIVHRPRRERKAFVPGLA
jgi:hypothetical protein